MIWLHDFTSHQIPFRVLVFIVFDIYTERFICQWYRSELEFKVKHSNCSTKLTPDQSYILIFFHWWHKFGHIYISKRNLFQKYAKSLVLVWGSWQIFRVQRCWTAEVCNWCSISWNLSKFELIQTAFEKPSRNQCIVLAGFIDFFHRFKYETYYRISANSFCPRIVSSLE